MDAGADLPHGLCLEPEALGKLMPMFVWVGSSGHIRATGPTLGTIARVRFGPQAVPGTLLGARFLEVFELLKPGPAATLAEFAAFAGRRLHLGFRGVQRPLFRGQSVALGSGQGVLVDLSFGISAADAVRDYGLTSTDFAPTDLTLEMLGLSEARAAVMEELAALNLRLKDAHRAAAEQALTDPLTGLANRRAFDAALTSAAARLARSGAGFALLHLDLDYFKDVNDTLGHAAGDEVLRRVAEGLRAEARRGDLIARVGGDEFVLMLGGPLEADDVMSAGRRIIARLEAETASVGSARPVSGSIGATLCLPGDARDGARMLADADQALYASKDAGRSTITLHGMTPG